MDQAAKPVIIAASSLLVVSLITLGVKSGGVSSDPVNGDGPVAAGTDDTTSGTPDTDVEPTPDAAPDPTTDGSTDGATDGSTDGATDGTTDGSTDGATDGSTDGSTDGNGSSSDGSTTGSDLDDMPQTGGGTAVALGGLIAASGALGLRRRN